MSSTRAEPVTAGDESVWDAGPHDVGLLRARYVRQSFPKHTHDCFVVCVNERGAHASWYAGETVIIPEGAICVVPPGEVHTGFGIPGAPWHYRAMYPSAEVIESAATALDWAAGTEPGFRALFVKDADLASEFVRAHRQCEVTKDPLEREGLIGDVLMAVVRRHATPVRPRTECVSSDAIERAMDYMRSCFAKRITLDTLAEAAGVSRYGVLRAFRQKVGIAPYAFVTQVRVEEAKRLLMAGTPIATVSQRVGFADQSHLNRHFKRLVGVTPGTFVRGARAA